MSKICVNCAKEMRCLKTGAKAVYQGSHVYPGDIFECPACKAKIMVTANAPHSDPNVFLKPHRDPDEMVIAMDMAVPVGDGKRESMTFPKAKWRWEVCGVGACVSKEAIATDKLEPGSIKCNHTYSHTLLTDVKKVMLHHPESTIQIIPGKCQCGK